MESLYDLEKKLSQYETELSSISKRVIKDTPFMPGQLDGHSESYTLESYSNPDRAKFLQSQIADLKSRIGTYAKDAETIRRNQEYKEASDKEWREDKITHTANVIYEQNMDAYMAKNFWGKAKALFTGKKPKKLNQQQVVETYGKEAVDEIINPAIKELMQQKQEQLDSVKKTYANEPEMLEYAIKSTEEYFDAEIAKVKATFDKSLIDVKRGM